MTKKQFNVSIDEQVIERVEDFASKNKKLFKEKRGYQSQAAQLLLEAGLDVLENEIKQQKEERHD